MDREIVGFLRGVTVVSLNIFYVGEFSFPVCWYIDPGTHELRGEMFVDHESQASVGASNELPIEVSIVTTRGFDTRAEFEEFAKEHEVLMEYEFDWPALEKRYGVHTEEEQELAET